MLDKLIDSILFIVVLTILVFLLILSINKEQKDYRRGYEDGLASGKITGNDTGMQRGIDIGTQRGIDTGIQRGFNMGIMQEKVNNEERIKKEKQVIHDLHGFNKKQANKYVLRVLVYASYHGLRNILFITGKGIHSPNKSPIIRPLVIKLCNRMGFKAVLRPDNEGVVEVFINLM